MSTTITKIGNSQGVRINKTILEKLDLSVNDKVNIDIKDNKIIIEKKKEKHNNIYELFANYKNDNIGEALVLDDEAVGNEIW